MATVSSIRTDTIILERLFLLLAIQYSGEVISFSIFNQRFYCQGFNFISRRPTVKKQLILKNNLIA